MVTPSRARAPPCTRAHQIGALALASIVFFFARSLDRPATCVYSPSPPTTSLFDHAGTLRWPERGYGSVLSLKIYVYDEREIDGLRALLRGRDGRISAESCFKGQWGTQVKIHQLMLKSKFRTLKKEEADLFFVPSYVKCVRMNGGLNDKEINQTYVKGDRTDKRDTSAFNTWKDIIIPGNVDDGMTNFMGSSIVQPIPLSKRKYLANFLGRAQGKVGRLQLAELAKQYPNKLESPELKLTGPDKLGRTEYFNHLRNAKFCVAPRGESSWTLRFYESFFVECVPVILSDKVELPFQNVIDYTQFSIKWPSTKIGPELLDYLQSIPDEVIHEMLAHGRLVRCLFVYAPETGPCSAMLGIMWELQRKVRRFHQSAETFWLHNGSIVNRDLVEFHNWRTPVPLP
ncbi:probable glycosyltransferase At5g25310 isoform X2 [Dioscorea cayenensis subsp. rotundata]|uniref:Probable glycosyltransferase At5g25310 isoform X2 n=1 Tax=Dioscorea cayennensis subsp. rotundata TaxID=55577 RepID=A0AB40CK11_DIOCR|nr:probable glycosyltransferase At5g25310 isoform X2 [Dioscorea cayenensis subsp. rotundata]